MHLLLKELPHNFEGCTCCKLLEGVLSYNRHEKSSFEHEPKEMRKVAAKKSNRLCLNPKLQKTCQQKRYEQARLTCRCNVPQTSRTRSGHNHRQDQRWTPEPGMMGTILALSSLLQTPTFSDPTSTNSAKRRSPPLPSLYIPATRTQISSKQSILRTWNARVCLLIVLGRPTTSPAAPRVHLTCSH